MCKKFVSLQKATSKILIKIDSIINNNDPRSQVASDIPTSSRLKTETLENYEMANDLSERDYFNDMIITQTIANFKLGLQIDDLESRNDIQKFKVHIL